MLFDDNFGLRFDMARTFPVSEQKMPLGWVRPPFERLPQKPRFPYFYSKLFAKTVFLEGRIESLKAFEFQFFTKKYTIKFNKTWKERNKQAVKNKRRYNKRLLTQLIPQ